MQATDKLKSEEELAKEEKERLDKLEVNLPTLIYKLVSDGKCRLYNSTFIVNIILIFVKADRHRRMKGIAVEEEEEKKRVHFSADDLNDK